MTDENLDLRASLELRHLRFGWWTVFAFLLLGLVLEGLHAFKADLLLNVENETRRHMWTLAHAHGTLLGLTNVAMSYTLGRLSSWPAGSRQLASRCLCAASILIPAGFFLGGVVIHAGDPGVGAFLVPPGALLLLAAIFLAAREATRSRDQALGSGCGPRRPDQ